MVLPFLAVVKHFRCVFDSLVPVKQMYVVAVVIIIELSQAFVLFEPTVDRIHALTFLDSVEVMNVQMSADIPHNALWHIFSGYMAVKKIALQWSLPYFVIVVLPRCGTGVFG